MKRLLARWKAFLPPRLCLCLLLYSHRTKMALTLAGLAVAAGLFLWGTHITNATDSPWGALAGAGLGGLLMHVSQYHLRGQSLDPIERRELLELACEVFPEQAEKMLQPLWDDRGLYLVAVEKLLRHLTPAHRAAYLLEELERAVPKATGDAVNRRL